MTTNSKRRSWKIRVATIRSFACVLGLAAVSVAGTANADRHVARVIGYVPGIYNNRELLLVSRMGVLNSVPLRFVVH